MGYRDIDQGSVCDLSQKQKCIVGSAGRKGFVRMMGKDWMGMEFLAGSYPSGGLEYEYHHHQQQQQPRPPSSGSSPICSTTTDIECCDDDTCVEESCELGVHVQTSPAGCQECYEAEKEHSVAKFPCAEETARGRPALFVSAQTEAPMWESILRHRFSSSRDDKAKDEFRASMGLSNVKSDSNKGDNNQVNGDSSGGDGFWSSQSEVPLYCHWDSHTEDVRFMTQMELDNHLRNTHFPELDAVTVNPSQLSIPCKWDSCDQVLSPDSMLEHIRVDHILNSGHIPHSEHCTDYHGDGYHHDQPSHGHNHYDHHKHGHTHQHNHEHTHSHNHHDNGHNNHNHGHAYLQHNHRNQCCSQNYQNQGIDNASVLKNLAIQSRAFENLPSPDSDATSTTPATPFIENSQPNYTKINNDIDQLLQCQWDGCHFSTTDNCLLESHLSNDHRLNSKPPPLQQTTTSEHGSSLLITPKEEKSAPAVKKETSSSLTCQWIEEDGTPCGCTFSSTSDLSDHVIRGHIGSRKKSYVCRWKDCDREHRPFQQRQKIVRHLQVHTRDKPFQCHICGKSFGEKAVLKQHQRTHSGEKPFQCQICGKAFSVSTALSVHVRVHTGEKPLVCKYPGCNKRFAESSNLAKHMKTHSDFKTMSCPHDGCHKKFRRKDQLDKHLREVHG
ncbi:hypothetical protein TRVA0_006S01288 [Trichomonascus vanleenenianus]|uniref:Zap1p n=1 Tax=Trichomonascus vanleenenianus TaxID=2268995 RepID=UPI003ECB6699